MKLKTIGKSAIKWAPQALRPLVSCFLSPVSYKIANIICFNSLNAIAGGALNVSFEQTFQTTPGRNYFNDANIRAIVRFF